MVHVVVIGSGAGGAATAARLAHAGHRVTVLEKNAFTGGRCSLIERGGFRFDQGASLYLMPEVFEETFAAVGERIDEHIALKRCMPNYDVLFADGARVRLSSDVAELEREVAAAEARAREREAEALAGKRGAVPRAMPGVAGLHAYLAEARTHYRLSFDFALSRNYETWYEFAQPWHLVLALKLHVLDTVWRRACKFFGTEELRRAFSFQTMYMGMSPYDAPATYSLLQHAEIAGGIWYPVGGFHRVVDRLLHVASQRGATVRTNAEVARIDIDEAAGLAKGVVLADGTRIECDAVVCNADLVWAYTHLFPDSCVPPPMPTDETPARPIPRHIRRLDALRQTCSTISFYWGMRRQITELAHAHTIFLSDDYAESFDRIFDGLSLPGDPSFYVHVPSRLDPTAAPAGKDTVTILVPVGHMRHADMPGEDQDYEAMQRRAREWVISEMERRLHIVGLADLIEVEQVNNPMTWRNAFNLYKGSALGLSHDIWQVLYMRPSTRHAAYGNVFFVGASTHPGTGVPVVLMGARLVAEQVMQCSSTGFVRAYGLANWAGGVVLPLLALLAAMAVMAVTFGVAGISSGSHARVGLA